MSIEVTSISKTKGTLSRTAAVIFVISPKDIGRSGAIECGGTPGAPAHRTANLEIAEGTDRSAGRVANSRDTRRVDQVGKSPHGAGRIVREHSRNQRFCARAIADALPSSQIEYSNRLVLSQPKRLRVASP
jgi:hypothetical protein